MANRILVLDQEKCSGCCSCQVWCSFHHFQACSPSLSRLMVVPVDDKGLFTPVVCNHCEDAWCQNECSFDAIKRDSVTNAVVIDEELCSGCGDCVDACPFGVIIVSPEGDVFKCDLCGGSPACVESCTRRAMTYVEPTAEYIERVMAPARRSGGEK